MPLWEAEADELGLMEFLKIVGRRVKTLQSQYRSDGLEGMHFQIGDTLRPEQEAIPLNEEDLNIGLATMLAFFALFFLLIAITCRLCFCYMSFQQQQRRQNYDTYLSNNSDFAMKPMAI